MKPTLSTPNTLVLCGALFVALGNCTEPNEATTFGAVDPKGGGAGASAGSVGADAVSGASAGDGSSAGDGGTMETAGASTANDGGSANDGGTAGSDDGTMETAGGNPANDGGSANDGGTMETAGASTANDGGSANDGGTAGSDGGSEVSTSECEQDEDCPSDTCCGTVRACRSGRCVDSIAVDATCCFAGEDQMDWGCDDQCRMGCGTIGRCPRGYVCRASVCEDAGYCSTDESCSRYCVNEVCRCVDSYCMVCGIDVDCAASADGGAAGYGGATGNGSATGNGGAGGGVRAGGRGGAPGGGAGI